MKTLAEFRTVCFATDEKNCGKVINASGNKKINITVEALKEQISNGEPVLTIEAKDTIEKVKDSVEVGDK